MYLKTVRQNGTVYTHALNEAAVVISKETETNDAFQPVAQIERWAITGRLIADTESALTTLIEALEAQYTTNLQSIAILSNDGTTETAHTIDNNQTIGGIVVESLSYPKGDGAQYAGFRDYEMVFTTRRGLVLVGGQQAPFSYQETLSFVGTGGPRRVIRELRNGPPQVQIVSQSTPVFATQIGSAIGHSVQPNPAFPIWPDHEDEPSRTITRRNPKTYGTGGNLISEMFETSWSYRFMAPGPLNGQPNIGFK